MSSSDISFIFDQINHLNKPIKTSNSAKNEEQKEGVDRTLAEIADEIRRVLEENDLTQDELCKRTGMSQSNISKILNSRIIPRIETLQKIADATNTKLIIAFEKKAGDEE